MGRGPRTSSSEAFAASQVLFDFDITAWNMIKADLNKIKDIGFQGVKFCTKVKSIETYVDARIAVATLYQAITFTCKDDHRGTDTNCHVGIYLERMSAIFGKSKEGWPDIAKRLVHLDWEVRRDSAAHYRKDISFFLERLVVRQDYPWNFEKITNDVLSLLIEINN